MEQVIRVGIDTSKTVFQLHGVNDAEQVILKKRLRRKDMVGFFADMPPTESPWKLAAALISGLVC